MHSRNKFILINLALLALLSLISCTAKSNITKPLIDLTNTPLPPLTPTILSLPSSTVLAPTITVSPSIATFPIPDGRILFEAYISKNGTRYPVINLMNLKINDTIQLIEGNEDVNGQEVSLFYPNMAWSPDGHQFAFIGTDIRANVYIYAYQDIFISKTDGTGLHRLTHSPQYSKHYLSWSPNSQQILVAMGKDTSSDLYLVGSENGEIIKRLTSSGNVFMGTWSPDGKRIAFEENSKLNILDVDNMTSQVISGLSISPYLGGISWSSNGKQ